MSIQDIDTYAYLKFDGIKCMQGHFAWSTLTNGFGFGPDSHQQIYLRKYNSTKLDWTPGALINEMSILQWSLIQPTQGQEEQIDDAEEGLGFEYHTQFWGREVDGNKLAAVAWFTSIANVVLLLIIVWLCCCLCKSESCKLKMKNIQKVLSKDDAVTTDLGTQELGKMRNP